MKLLCSNLLATLVFTGFSSTVIASSAIAAPISLSDLQLRGDCENDDIRIVQEGEKYFIEAQFLDMNVVAEPGEYIKKKCHLQYSVDLPQDYHLELFQFSVDGVADISEKGSGRLTISHRVSNYPPARSSFRFKTGFEDFYDNTGAIYSNNLPGKYQECGASIPLKTDLYIAARANSQDEADSIVDLDSAVTSGYTRLCEVVVHPCK